MNTDAKEADEDKMLGALPLFYLHGGLTQQQRTKAYLDFCHTQKGALFCTDVAARGLDLPKVSVVASHRFYQLYLS